MHMVQSYGRRGMRPEKYGDATTRGALRQRSRTLLIIIINVTEPYIAK